MNKTKRPSRDWKFLTDFWIKSFAFHSENLDVNVCEQIVADIKRYREEYPEHFKGPFDVDFYSRDREVVLSGNDKKTLLDKHGKIRKNINKHIGVMKVQNENAPENDLSRWAYGLKRNVLVMRKEDFEKEKKDQERMKNDLNFFDYKAGGEFVSRKKRLKKA